jgi:spermidine synthase
MMHATNRDGDIALIGMGVGTQAAYGHAGMRMTYFEIDPAVARIAQDPAFFSFLAQSEASVRVVLGDGRAMLAREPKASFDMLVLDAFTSDAIPVHLLTREAFSDVYLPSLREHGIVLVHVSNRYFDLVPELGTIASELGLACVSRNDPLVLESQRAEGKQESVWVLIARKQSDLGSLGRMSMWDPVQRAHDRAWTDDYASLLRALVR